MYYVCARLKSQQRVRSIRTCDAVQASGRLSDWLVPPEKKAIVEDAGPISVAPRGASCINSRDGLTHSFVAATKWTTFFFVDNGE